MITLDGQKPYFMEARNYEHAMSLMKSPQSREVMHTALVHFNLATGERILTTEDIDDVHWEGWTGHGTNYGDTGHLINGCPRTKS